MLLADDTKVTNSELFGQMTAHAASGPSSSASSPISVLAPFSWRPAVDEKTLHIGLPQKYDFGFVTVAAKEV